MKRILTSLFHDPVILIFDDGAKIVEFLESKSAAVPTLSTMSTHQTSYECICSSDGSSNCDGLDDHKIQKVAESYRSFGVDCVFLDNIMLTMNGPEAASLLRHKVCSTYIQVHITHYT